MSEELARPAALAATPWPRRVAWTLTAFSGALNVLNLPHVVASVPLVHNLMGLLWLFSTHALLVLASCSLLVPLARRQSLTQRGAIVGLGFALLSLLAFPVSYAATILFASGGINRLF